MTYPRVAIRRVAKIVNGGTPTPDESNWGGAVPWATPVDLGVSNGRSLSTTLRSLSVSGALSGSTVVPAGSILLSTRAPIGYVAQASVPIAFNQGCKALVLLDSTSSKFLLYALNSVSDELQSMGQGSTFTELSTSALASIRIPRPPLGEQRKIAEYLDREIGKIDEVIAKQHLLVEILAERLTSLLIHSTHQPDLPWIGRVGQILTKLNRAAPRGSETLTAFRDGQVTLRSLRRADGYTFSSNDDGYQGVYAGDLVFHGLDGFAGAVGIAEASGTCSPVYHVAELRGEDNIEYVALLLRALGVTGFLATQAGNVRQRSVDFRNWASLARLPIALPSPAEQRRLVKKFRLQKERTDVLSARVTETVALLRERRMALISAAVTGKIDVRGL